MKTQRSPQPSVSIAGKESFQPSSSAHSSAFNFPPSAFFPSPSRRAFTLVEMLVSISVLVLLIVLVTQLLNSATKVTTGSRNHMDTDAQARLVFDRMATDFGSMLQRKDVDYVFNKQAGNDNFYFYSEAPAYFTGTAATQNPVSLVGYRINQTTFQLERLGKGLSWDGASAGQNTPGSVVFLTYPPHDPTATPTPFPQSTISTNWADAVDPTKNDTDFHVISDQVYRMEFTFLLKNGTYSDTPYIAPNTTINGWKDVSAIVVAIGILDNNSRKIGQVIQKTVDDLKDIDPTKDLAASPPVLMATKWLATVNGNSFASDSGLPQLAAGQVRIYQRTFYLNNINDL